MVKSIDTLVEDIYGLLSDGKTDEELLRDSSVFEEFGKAVADTLKEQLTRRDRGGFLRMSSIGRPCSRQTYYSVNSPEDAEPLQPWVKMKFLFGHILEEVLLTLTTLSGHHVTGRQGTQEILGVPGHRDALIDGVLVDVKSASTFSYKKFESGKLSEDDPFGYLTQLNSYGYSGQDDDEMTEKSYGAFLVVDKTLGHLLLDKHEFDFTGLEDLYSEKISMIDEEEPPKRGFDPVPDGKSGNMKLGMNCGYCDFREKCWPTARTFLYSNGPVHLTTIKRMPNVPELRRKTTQ